MYEEFKRDKYCGEVSEQDEGKRLRLTGWVHRVRNHGGVVFVDLRDREGVLQVVAEEKTSREAYEVADRLKPEFVIGVEGVVRRRPPGTENPKLKTGNWELVAEKIVVLNESAPLPFPVDEETPVSEELKLRYRYLDLRRERMRENLLFRSRAYRLIRDFLYEKGFVEVETPFLTKSTPEGARDFLVPSRLHPGKFYALPQSPQLFKQILMVAGFDRYFQIVKCLRDEDLRADRQPEFTQVDLELSFADEEEVMSLSEELVALLFKELLGVELKRPFERVSYREALERYGTDKPDRRFGMELVELTDLFKESAFKVFREPAASGGKVKAIKVPKLLSRKELDELTRFVRGLGAGGLAWVKYEKGALSSPIVKFFSEQEKEGLIRRTGLKEGETLLFSAGDKELTYKVLSALRLRLAEELGLKREGFDVLWVVDFPFAEWDEEEGRFTPLHHPFTMPRKEDLPLLEEALKTDRLEEKIALVERVRSRAYDLVINGEEVGGGSVRIHKPEIQQKVFKLLGIGEVEAQEKFGFLLEALRYGAPPHAGIAFGLDRLLALMLGLDSIRDVIAFPKTQKGVCPLTGAPDFADPKQLKELKIKVLE
ncbi:MAG: aspartate--tRNA ligase [Aquificae bacterium]|nr:aspartate--tRNA ligase [Aquificota bacterium]